MPEPVKKTEIMFCGKIYEIERKKAAYIVRILENREDLEIENENELMKFFNKHKLFDEIFLERVNELW